MILYFSGTGNSEYVAKRISTEIEDDILNLFEKIRTNDFSEMHSERPWVIVVPTYAWRIPHIIQNWLKNTNLAGNNDIYFVMTCGGSIANAGKYLEKTCSNKKMHYRGCFEVVMPENYIAMFTTPDAKEAQDIIAQAEKEIDRAVLYLQNGQSFPSGKITLSDKISSGIVNSIFYPMFVHAKKFYATDACISCGKCARVCPLNNVRLENEKPIWGDDCTHCMACICHCPTKAIEYGKHSKDLPRYTCPK